MFSNLVKACNHNVPQKYIKTKYIMTIIESKFTNCFFFILVKIKIRDINWLLIINLKLRCSPHSVQNLESCQHHMCVHKQPADIRHVYFFYSIHRPQCIIQINFNLSIYFWYNMLYTYYKFHFSSKHNPNQCRYVPVLLV